MTDPELPGHNLEILLPLHRLWQLATPWAGPSHIRIPCEHRHRNQPTRHSNIRLVTLAILGRSFWSKGGRRLIRISELENIFLNLYLGPAAFGSRYISRVLWILTSEQQTKRISSRCLFCILNQEMEYFDKITSGNPPTAHMQNDIPLIRAGIGENTGV
ncbi:hypothetical protein BJ742DRAFT_206308 [Cladochytrium replicatum]|nr:hypothetical protein BJ742DRAFT_206308 [Cladochytrium replicatum]